MARSNRKSQVTATEAADAHEEAAAALEASHEELSAELAPAAAPVRRTLAAAKSNNFGLAPNPSALARAALIKPAKGENPKRVRVYGYDNGADGGRVPKDAVVQVVPGVTGLPKGVTAGQWARLQELAGYTTRGVYDNGVTSRTVRRSYRAGFIRFVGQDAQAE